MYLAVMVNKDFNIKEFLKNIKPTLHFTNAGSIMKGKDFAIIVAGKEYIIFYTKEEFLEDYRNEGKFIVKVELERIKDFLLKENNLFNQEELKKAFLFNRNFIIKKLLENGLFEDYKVLSIEERSLNVLNEFSDVKPEINIPYNLHKMIDSVSEFNNLYKVFDSMDLSKKCLDKTEDYDKRIFDLAKKICDIKDNHDKYEFRITDGNLEAKDLYYIVCWIEKKHYEQNKEYLKKDISFKCRTEHKGDSFIIELSEYPKSDYVLRNKKFNDQEYLYSLYLVYLYTRNLERLDF